MLDADNLVIPRRKIPAGTADAELQRFTVSLEQTVKELSAQRDELVANQRKEIAGILDFHIGVLKDKSLVDQIGAQIRDQLSTAEYAVSSVMKNYAAVFSRMTDAYLAERVKDIQDIERQLLNRLAGR